MGLTAHVVGVTGHDVGLTAHVVVLTAIKNRNYRLSLLNVPHKIQTDKSNSMM